MPKETIEIKVSQRTPCNSLGASIVIAWNEGKEVVLSAIGPVPISQCYKAVCIANRALASRGVILTIIPGLVMKEMPDLENAEKTVPWVVAKMRLRDFLASNLPEEDANAIIQVATKEIPDT